MKKVKSLFALMLAFVILSSANTFALEKTQFISQPVIHSDLKIVGAMTDDSFEEWFEAKLDSLEKVIQSSLAINGLSTDFIAIGSPIQVINKDAVYVPVMDSDGNFLNMVFLCKDDTTGEISATIGCFFADELNQLDKSQVYAIVEDDNGNIFAISESQTTVLQLSLTTPSEQDALQNISNMNLDITYDQFVDV